ncbi:tripartite tricarboxylate transporter substrate binding protein [Pigmentiphaga soli]|uniref:Tripartite tricarboxylate transporter substrate binding protein n=1 Tax=Pigmentiphaga soli TaxID=1007095 RepID=A0ABP8GP65_9BURK
MHNKISISTIRRALGLATLLAPLAAGAGGFPAKPVQIVVPFGAGSITDVVARVIAEHMREGLGQPVIVENKPGVGGIVGAANVAKAPADGYTLLLGSNSTNAINQSLFKSLPYDPIKDLVPVSMAGEIPAVMIARADHRANTLQDVVDLAKAAPGRLTFGIGNTTNRVAGEMLQKAGKFEAVIVPYRGEPYGLTDLLGGQVDFMFLNLPVAYPHLQTGKVKAIALTGVRRVSAMPSIPVAGETLAGFSMPDGWLAFFAPAGTPPQIIRRLNEEIVAALDDAEVRKRLEATGGYVVKSSTPDELGERVASDAKRWADLIKAANIPLQ